VTVLDASCILTYRLKNDSQRTWVPAKELVCDNLPSERVWGVSFTRGARQDQLHLVVLNDDGHWSIRGLVWVSDTNTWHFYWVSLNFEEASAVDSVLSSFPPPPLLFPLPLSIYLFNFLCVVLICILTC
jgi:hypothetical protein